MSKIGIVTKFEVMRQLKKPSFWISLILFPLAIFAIIGLSMMNGYNTSSTISGSTDLNGKTIGITDDSDLYEKIDQTIIENYDLAAQMTELEENEGVKVIEIESKEEGIEKVQTGELSIYYYISDQFLEDYSIEVYHLADKTGIFKNYSDTLSNALKSQAISKLSIEYQVVVSGGITYNDIAIDEEGEAKNILGEAIVPIIVLVIFYILVCVFGNRLVTALAEEKENRISEMILTSVSAKSLVTGKIISLIILGFIQIAVFIIPLLAALVIFRDNPVVATVLQMISVNPWVLISNILLLIVSYFFYAGACTLVSSLMPTARDASNYFGIVIIGIIAPMFFISSFMAETTNMTVYILTYFPLSAPIALMLRNALGSLPTIELIIGLVELALCSAITLELTVKSFQKNAINFSMPKLNMGKRKNWKK